MKIIVFKKLAVSKNLTLSSGQRKRIACLVMLSK